MRRGDIRVRLAGSPPVASEVRHVAPLVSLAVGGTGIERCVSRMARGGEATLIHVWRRVWTWGLVLIHGREEMWRRWRTGLSGCHLGHQLGGVDRLVLLLLGVEQLRIEGAAEELVLIEVVSGVEVVEIGVVAVGDVEGVGREVVAALRAKVGRVVVGEALGGLQEVVLVGERRRKLLALRRRGQVLRVVEASAGDLEAGGGVEAESGRRLVEGRMGRWRGLPYICAVPR